MREVSVWFQVVCEYCKLIVYPLDIVKKRLQAYLLASYWCQSRTQIWPRDTTITIARGGGDVGEGDLQWQNGALATDGAIYCISSDSSRVLVIDPFKEFSATLQTNMILYPDELGRLFLKDEEGHYETFF